MTFFLLYACKSVYVDKGGEGVEKKVMNDSFDFHEHPINDEIAFKRLIEWQQVTIG